MQAGADADCGGPGLLACSWWLARLLFDTSQAHLHRDDKAHSGLGPPTDMATANPVEAFSVEGPSVYQVDY